MYLERLILTWIDYVYFLIIIILKQCNLYIPTVDCIGQSQVRIVTSFLHLVLNIWGGVLQVKMSEMQNPCWTHSHLIMKRDHMETIMEDTMITMVIIMKIMLRTDLQDKDLMLMSVFLLWQPQLLDLMGKDVLTKLRWLKRQSMMMLFSVTTVMTRDATQHMSPTMSPNR